jgi:hypothetical protein
MAVRQRRRAGVERGGELGQASVEWLGLVCLVGLLVAAALAFGAPRVPGASLAELVGQRLLCAVGAGACGETPELIAEYGPEIAELLRRHAPGLALERGMDGLPVDFRNCDRPDCAARAERPVAFTRVLERQGSTYLQFWFYYPESATFRGLPLLAERGFHRNDWESYQVRIDSSGEVAARASSHHGHNHRLGIVNWASDAGLGPVNSVLEGLGVRPRRGWGRPSGWLYVSAGSHAGNVEGNAIRAEKFIPADELHLIPLESIADDVRQPDFAPITPPWRKELWRQPEAAGTS